MPILILIIVLSIVGIMIFVGTRRTFDDKKSHIMNLYSSVLSDMNIDFRDWKIHNTNIHEISRSIQNLANEIDDTAKGIIHESVHNQEWLTGIINEFNIQLRIWIDRHTDELETIESEIYSTTSEKNSEKAVLELAYTRLDIHRKVFEKI